MPRLSHCPKLVPQTLDPTPSFPSPAPCPAPAQAILSGEKSSSGAGKDAALDAAMTHDFARVITPETPMNEETEGVCTMMVEMLEMRNKWLFKVGKCVEVWGSVVKCGGRSPLFSQGKHRPGLAIGVCLSSPCCH